MIWQIILAYSINIIGLAFDFKGVYMIFVYTPNPASIGQIPSGTLSEVKKYFAENERLKVETKKRLHRGLYWIFAGFMLQIISSFSQMAISLITSN